MDEILADENVSGGVLWPLRDQFYNVRDLVDHQGAHYSHIDYDTFGKIINEQRAGTRTHAYGFQSRERDQETQLNYHRSRYYDPRIGRWMSEDPIGFAGGDVNLNRFVGNSPTNLTDHDGLLTQVGSIRTHQPRKYVRNPFYRGEPGTGPFIPLDPNTKRPLPEIPKIGRPWWDPEGRSEPPYDTDPYPYLEPPPRREWPGNGKGTGTFTPAN